MGSVMYDNEQERRILASSKKLNPHWKIPARKPFNFRDKAMQYMYTFLSMNIFAPRILNVYSVSRRASTTPVYPRHSCPTRPMSFMSFHLLRSSNRTGGRIILVFLAILGSSGTTKSPSKNPCSVRRQEEFSGSRVF